MSKYPGLNSKNVDNTPYGELADMVGHKSSDPAGHRKLIKENLKADEDKRTKGRK